jgi:hypothetical protein
LFRGRCRFQDDCSFLRHFGSQGTEGGNLDDLVMEVNMGKTEPATDKPAVAEGLLHFVGRGVRGDVKVLRLPAQEQVPYAAADQVGEVSLLLETVEHAKGVGTDPLAGDGVFRSGDNDWLNAHIGIIAHTVARVKRDMEGAEAR